MAIAFCFTSVWTDDELRDGQLRVEPRTGAEDLLDTFMSPATFLAMSYTEGCTWRVSQFVRLRGTGLYSLPLSLFTGEGEDTQRALELMSSYEDIDRMSSYEDTGCAMPDCWQDAVDQSRGFPLCVKHRDDLLSWDELLAA